MILICCLLLASAPFRGEVSGIEVSVYSTINEGGAPLGPQASQERLSQMVEKIFELEGKELRTGPHFYLPVKITTPAVDQTSHGSYPLRASVYSFQPGGWIRESEVFAEVDEVMGRVDKHTRRVIFCFSNFPENKPSAYFITVGGVEVPVLVD